MSEARGRSNADELGQGHDLFRSHTYRYDIFGNAKFCAADVQQQFQVRVCGMEATCNIYPAASHQHQNNKTMIRFVAFVYITTYATLLNNTDFSRTNAFALSVAKGKKSNGNKINNTGKRVQPPKGFAKTETIDDLLRTFPSRRPDQTNHEQPCPCGVGNVSYRNCCYPYHEKLKLPETPKRVLQTRYSAFVYRLIGYIIDTTHPSCRDYRHDKLSWAKLLNKNGMFDSVDFMTLNITNCGEMEQQLMNRSEDYIDFEVTLRAKQNTRQSSDLGSESLVCIQERSKFIKNNTTGSWTYATGVVRSTTNGMEDLILNP